MKGLWLNFRKYFKSKIWAANLIGIILSAIIVIMYVFVPNQINFDYSIYVYIVFAILTSFFFSYSGLLFFSISDAIFKSTNSFLHVVKWIIVLLYILFFLRFMIEFLMKFYSKNLGVDPEDYLSAMISLLSLSAAILIPMILTNINRKDTEKLIKDQRENDTIPIFKFEKIEFSTGNGIIGLQKIQKFSELKLDISMKNIVDRVAILYSYSFNNNDELIRKNYLVKDETVEFKIDISEELGSLKALKDNKTYKINFKCNIKNIYLIEYTQTFEIIFRNYGNMLYVEIGDYGPLKLN